MPFIPFANSTQEIVGPVSEATVISVRSPITPTTSDWRMNVSLESKATNVYSVAAPLKPIETRLTGSAKSIRMPLDQHASTSGGRATVRNHCAGGKSKMAGSLPAQRVSPLIPAENVTLNAANSSPSRNMPRYRGPPESAGTKESIGMPSGSVPKSKSKSGVAIPPVVETATVVVLEPGALVDVVAAGTVVDSPGAEVVVDEASAVPSVPKGI